MIQRNPDHEHDIRSAYTQQITLMASDEPFFTFFDYTSAAVRIAVQTVSQSPIANFVKEPGSRWPEILAPACGKNTDVCSCTSGVSWAAGRRPGGADLGDSSAGEQPSAARCSP
ncbi:hypothetical protein B0H14DRAFT_3445380 [Mycena olivaceomarginata]|nr:hypothetical protein B0H14DRAFT_3445380 [Mycena olivaceomarginata]